MPQVLWIGTVALMAIAAIPLTPVAAGFLAFKGLAFGIRKLFRSDSPRCFTDFLAPCRAYPTTA